MYILFICRADIAATKKQLLHTIITTFFFEISTSVRQKSAWHLLVFIGIFEVLDYLLSPNTTFKSTPMAGTPSLSLGINLKVSKFQRFQSSVNFAIFYSVMCILNNAMLHRQVFSLIIRLCYMIFFFYSAFSASHWSTFSLTSATNLSWSVSMAIVLFCRFVHCRGRVSYAIPTAILKG